MPLEKRKIEGKDVIINSKTVIVEEVVDVATLKQVISADEERLAALRLEVIEVKRRLAVSKELLAEIESLK